MENKFEFDSILDNEITNPFVGKRTLTLAASDKKSWRLSSYRDYNSDKRDDASTYVCIHNGVAKMPPGLQELQMLVIGGLAIFPKKPQEFAFVKVGDFYKIALITEDEYQESKWMLTCHRGYDKDKRDAFSTYVFLHQNHCEGQLWNIEKDGEGFRITQVDSAYDQAGWYLTTHVNFSSDQRDENSIYLFLHKEKKEGSLWSIS